MSTFRKVYRQLSCEELEHIEQIKDMAERLEQLIKHNPFKDYVHTSEQARQIAVAMANLEQAVMWATKAYT